ncbi:MAG: CDP-alcohol phosphatidyltransferase family protein [Actinomycetota bacterium]
MSHVGATEPAGSAPPPPGDAGLRTVPNVLSLLRLLSVPVFLWLFISGRDEAAVILYGIGAWSDFFDGWIARRFHQVSEIGKLLDPLADRVFIVALAVALVARETLPLALAIAIIARDVLVLSLFPALERRGVERIRVNFVGKTATASLLFGLSCLAWSETSFPLHAVADSVGLAFTLFGAILYWVAATIYARQAMQALERVKVRDDVAI